MAPKIENNTHTEEFFHDQWAASANPEDIDVVHLNEVCTAPEMRFIKQRLGSLKQKALLDVGCGLGEASVYFALQGATVTATDLSQGMLDHTQALARRYQVSVLTHKSSAEAFELGEQRFDVIYVGNLFHHVDIAATLQKLKQHLKPDGVLISWDPIAYNPIINIYRKLATLTRTPDEHPLTVGDIKIFKQQFEHVETHFFWLSTLLIFILMFLWQRRSPNQERFWKKVLDEGDSWRGLYQPLEKLDQFLLRVFPPLRWLCWNVVVVVRYSQS